MTQRNRFIAAGALVLVIFAVAEHFLFPQKSGRDIASISAGPALVSKSLLAKANLNWRPESKGLSISVSNKEGDICDRYAQMQVVFRAEGIAYSGEVDRVVKTSQCEDRKFSQTWSDHITDDDDPSLTKKGVFIEEPPQWVLEQVRLVGTDGEIQTNTAEVFETFGSFPTIRPKHQ